MTMDSAPINLTHHFLIAMPGLMLKSLTPTSWDIGSMTTVLAALSFWGLILVRRRRRRSEEEDFVDIFPE